MKRGVAMRRESSASHDDARSSSVAAAGRRSARANATREGDSGQEQRPPQGPGRVPDLDDVRPCGDGNRGESGGDAEKGRRPPVDGRPQSRVPRDLDESEAGTLDFQPRGVDLAPLRLLVDDTPRRAQGRRGLR